MCACFYLGTYARFITRYASLISHTYINGRKSYDKVRGFFRVAADDADEKRSRLAFFAPILLSYNEAALVYTESVV